MIKKHIKEDPFTRIKLSIGIKLQINGEHLLGPTGAKMVEAIEKTGSIKRAAKIVNRSYRYVWAYLMDIERLLGVPIIETTKGGEKGGGTRLTKNGKKLLKIYHHYELKVRKLNL